MSAVLDGDVRCRLERWGIVNTVSRHCYNLITSLEPLHDAQFLVRDGTREENLGASAALLPSVLVKFYEVGAS